MPSVSFAPIGAVILYQFGRIDFIQDRPMFTQDYRYIRDETNQSSNTTSDNITSLHAIRQNALPIL